MIRRVALCIVLAAAASAPRVAGAQSAAPPATAATPAVPTGTVIYDRTRAVVAARNLPPFIAYTQYAAFFRRGKTQAERIRVVLRTADGKVNLTPIPDSPRDHIDVTPAVKDRPLVYPTTTFGLVRRRAGEGASVYESRSTPAPDPSPSGPAVIGHVVSTARDYDVTLLGTEMLEDASVFHLKLAPRFDPQHHPIRDMWVDTSTYDPRRIAIEVWAEAGPVRSRPTVTVDFAPVGGTWLIAHASMEFVLRLAFLSYGGSAEFRISDVSFPPAEPDWMFDPAALKAHLAQLPLRTPAP